MAAAVGDRNKGVKNSQKWGKVDPQLEVEERKTCHPDSE